MAYANHLRNINAVLRNNVYVLNETRLCCVLAFCAYSRAAGIIAQSLGQYHWH